MSKVQVFLAVALLLAAALITRGVYLLSIPGAWITGGVLVAAWALAMSSEVDSS